LAGLWTVEDQWRKEISQLVGQCVAAAQMSVLNHSATTVQPPDPTATTSVDNNNNNNNTKFV